jgi:hypothetical protein
VRERFFTPRLRVKSLEESNVLLLDKCISYARAHRHFEQTGRTIWTANTVSLFVSLSMFEAILAVPPQKMWMRPLKRTRRYNCLACIVDQSSDTLWVVGLS